MVFHLRNPIGGEGMPVDGSARIPRVNGWIVPLVLFELVYQFTEFVALSTAVSG